MTVEMIERLAKLIVQLGLSTVFAAVLLWFVLIKMTHAIDAMVAEMHTQTDTLIEIQRHVIERDKELFHYEWRRGKDD